jgi:hypothetical protein
VPVHALRERVQLRGARQLAVDEQVGHLQEAGARGELVDRVTPVAQDAGVAVDVGDRGLARRRVHEAGVDRDQTRVLEQRRHDDAVVALAGSDDRQGVSGSVDGELDAARAVQRCGGHVFLPEWRTRDAAVKERCRDSVDLGHDSIAPCSSFSNPSVKAA